MIDAHVHFWRPARGDDILILRREARLRRDYLPDDLAPLLATAGVSRAVVIQSAPSIDETRFQLALTRDLPWIAGVVGWVDLEHPDAGRDLDELQRDARFRGVRVMLHRLDDPAWIERPAALAGLRSLASRGLSLDLIAREPHLEACRRALGAVPGLRAVVDHGGGPPIAERRWEPWADAIARLARDTGALCKFSGLLEESQPGDGEAALLRYAGHLAASFGPARLVFASNWPVCDLVGGYARWLDIARNLARRLALPPAALFEANARRLYGLEPPPAAAAR
ncbi:MAG: amidohydrolase family protein [Alphaproteobacteria bacterium]|nr:amidohydrolase family protein [Alphaproteobacteria bacterium]